MATRAFTGTIHEADGTPWAGGAVTAALRTRPAAVGGTVYPAYVAEMETNGSGQFAGTLITPEEGEGALRYRFTLPDGYAFDYNVEAGDTLDLATVITAGQPVEGGEASLTTQLSAYVPVSQKAIVGGVRYQTGYDATAEGSLADALTAAGSDETYVLLRAGTNYALSANTTIPENVTLVWERGAKITLGAYDLTISGGMEGAILFDTTGAGSLTLPDGNTSPEWFEAKGDAAELTGLQIAASDNTLLALNATFSASSVGKVVWVYGAGANGDILQTTIATYNSPTSAELADAAVTAVTSYSGDGVWGSDDGAAIQAAIDAVPATTPLVMTLEPGAKYLVSPNAGPTFQRSNTTVLGHKAEIWGDTHAKNYAASYNGNSGSTWSHGLLRYGEQDTVGILYTGHLIQDVVFRNKGQENAGSVLHSLASVTTNASATGTVITSSGLFTSAMVGLTIVVPGAGPGGGDFEGVITTFSNSSQVLVATAVTASVTAAATVREEGWYSKLNDTSVTYTRRQNKQYNMAGAIELYEAGDVTVLGCAFHEVGNCIKGNSPTGKVTAMFNECKEGWGSTFSVGAGDGSVFAFNEGIQTAPLIGETDRSNNRGTSHAIYFSGGVTKGRVIGNYFKDARVAFCQLNTGSATAQEGFVVANNTVEGTYYAGYVGGSSGAHEVTFTGNKFKDCGAIVCSATLSTLTVSGNTFEGDHSVNAGAAISPDSAVAIYVTGNIFRDRSGVATSSAIQVTLQAAADLETVVFKGNTVDDCAFGVYVPVSDADAATRVYVDTNTFIDSSNQVGHATSSLWAATTTNPLVSFVNNEFHVNSAGKYGVYAYAGCSITRNTFKFGPLSALTHYGVAVDTVHGSAPVSIVSNTFDGTQGHAADANTPNGQSISETGTAAGDVVKEGNRYVNGALFCGGGEWRFSRTVNHLTPTYFPAVSKPARVSVVMGDVEEFIEAYVSSGGAITQIAASAGFQTTALTADGETALYQSGSRAVFNCWDSGDTTKELTMYLRD